MHTMMMSKMFQDMIDDDNSTEPVKEMLGDEYDSVVEKVKTLLKGNEVTISIPGFDKLKDQLAKDKEDSLKLNFNDAKKMSEQMGKMMNVTGNEYAVAALNFVQQAAAANLRFSSMHISMYEGAYKVAWNLEGIKFFNTVASAAKEAGTEKLVYGDKKAEEYKIPGVQSSEQIEEIKELGKDESGALAKTCHTVVLAIAVALMGWTM